MELEALKQLLASLDINPDEIEDEGYATAFRILFALIEKQNEEIEFLKAENQKLRDEINLLKCEQPKPNIRGSKKNIDISYPLQIRGRIFQHKNCATILSYNSKVECVAKGCFLDLAKFLNFQQICKIYFYPYNLKMIHIFF